MKYILALLLLSVGLNASVKDSIVKIYTVSKIPNYSIPWNSSIRRSNGSGSIVMGDRILTNAHVVANETFLEVKRHGDTKRYEAEVEYISHQADLALLKVKDKEFFVDTQSLELGELPKILQEITVYGFPMGGNSLSVSTGIVSRIEHNRYAHSREIFLSIQVDAAVNPGSSGGPAISDGKIVGVVMQQISKSQNIGYLVPSEVIKHFFEDIEDEKYDGYAHLGMSTQKMENEALRSIYKMKKGTTGVMVMDIAQTSSVHGILKDGDILTAVEGHKIENDGTVEFMPEQFTSYMYYVDKKQLGESVEFTLLRDGKEELLSIELKHIADNDLLVDTLEHDVMPRYYIYGGYVFTPLSRNLLVSSRSTLLDLRVASREWATQERDEVVILQKVLADKTNRGDHNFALWMIDKVNSKKFKNFSEFVSLIKESKGEFIVLENSDGVKVAIDKIKAEAIEEEILKRYSIKSSSSE
ncbi:trypsin-like serine protease [Sulfurimonas aquatica]|uniref:Trypsin-like serine protease n=1 Tax=Sulfurimonas aquatica TaxID=2672570 RepID=A0A975B031_9BACT|nr:S1C family serine protease [Sulfurimonas aquatica]QSZ41658.1 trypsin-like serine protease [Sulfurimonas aquatica]